MPRSDTYSVAIWSTVKRFSLNLLLNYISMMLKLLPQRWGERPGWGLTCVDMKQWKFSNPCLLILRKHMQDSKPDIWMQITIPNEFTPSVGKYNIGCTAGIESTGWAFPVYPTSRCN